MRTEWRGFKGNNWKSEVNIRDFIQNNYTSYDGDEIGRASCRERV